MNIMHYNVKLFIVSLYLLIVSTQVRCSLKAGVMSSLLWHLPKYYALNRHPVENNCIEDINASCSRGPSKLFQLLKLLIESLWE